jgi:hypothetical protein
MALTTCPECEKEMSSEAKRCPHCGYKIKTGKGCLVVLIVLAIVVVGGVTASIMSSGKPKLDTAVIEKNVASFQAARLVTKIEPNTHKAWVNPRKWYGIDAADKKAVAVNLAQYCAWIGERSIIAVDIYDSMSARKIASYHEGAGFKID